MRTWQAAVEEARMLIAHFDHIDESVAAAEAKFGSLERIEVVEDCHRQIDNLVHTEVAELGILEGS
jgi:hypothetical protein